MAKLIWSPRAIRDLEEICEYIARGSVRYAQLFAERVVAIVETLPENPLLGPIVPEFDRDDVREQVYHGYRIVYRLRGEAVEVVTIVHGARLLPRMPPTD